MPALEEGELDWGRALRGDPSGPCLRTQQLSSQWEAPATPLDRSFLALPAQVTLRSLPNLV